MPQGPPVQQRSPAKRQVEVVRVLASWQCKYPGTPLSAFAWWVLQITGYPLTEIITEQEDNNLMQVLGPDPIVAEALLEGLDSGP